MTEDKFPKTVLSLDSNVYGKEYLEELKKIMDIRKERKEIYGDSFKVETFDNLKSVIDGKLNRLNVLLSSQKLTHPKVRDELSDVCNYIIFALFKISEEENNG